MKKLTLLVLIVFFSFEMEAKNLSAVFSYCAFDVPGKSPYIETYLHVTGTSVNFAAGENNTLKGQVEVQWVIKLGDKIVKFDKYNLNSPNITSNDSIVPDFIDQQRIKLDRGKYNIEISIRDKNSDDQKINLSKEVLVGFPEDTISISDIELLESFSKSLNPGPSTKSGYDLTPSASLFYPKEIRNLKFYAEIYRSNLVQDDEYLVRYYISRRENNMILENYTASVKHKAQPVNVLLGDFPIKDLISGNYYLNIEIRNKRNQLIGYKNTMFQRSNQINKPSISADISAIDITNTFVSQMLNKDTLKEYISYLYPISSNVEGDAGERQIQSADTRSMQQFLYYFWSKRNPENPEKAWNDYLEEVAKVNVSYAAITKKGYQTDRGRVYLQYGPPNIVSDGREDPVAYPYEIWQYYQLKNQGAKRFVFYCTERSTNDYELLHSDAQGELQEPNWDAFLHKRTQDYGSNPDVDKSYDVYGSHSKEKYDNPH